jgi:C4-dicarboxylate transporter DctQ subunit
MKEQKDKLDSLLDRLNSVMAWIAALAIIFMMFAISYAVMMRYVWNKPVPWIVEISSYLMLYITFLGTAWLQRKGGHVEVDLFTGRLKDVTAIGILNTPQFLLMGIIPIGGFLLLVEFLLQARQQARLALKKTDTP